MATATHLWFVALDLVSVAGALTLAVFFARSARFTPGRGFGHLSAAFVASAIAYPATTLSRFRLLPDTDVDDAVRVAALFLSGLFLFLHYGGRHVGLARSATRIAAWAFALAALAVVAAYALAPAQTLPSPLAFLSAARFAETGMLLVVAAVVTLDVRARTWSEFRVPLAFICLAFSRYTTATLASVGMEINGWAYVWRLAGLALLLSVVLPVRRWAPEAT